LILGCVGCVFIWLCGFLLQGLFKRGLSRVSEFSFVVRGEPVGQGSMRHIGGGRMIASNDKKLKAWREAIALAVQSKRLETGELVSFAGAVRVDVKFCVPRVKAAAKRTHPTTPYDLDKQMRAVGDAISVNTDLVVNDSQIVVWNASKVFADGCPFGAHITVTEM
jgi:Holliday junction resolvase RusA-like endonuclease